jgi:type I restriction-modification system DNA methylase subunit
MSKTFEQGRDEVAALCQYFATNAAAFIAPGVKEAHIRQNLIDPLFEALGWDVRNAARVAPQYREVIPEDSLDVEGQQRAPDYTFRVGPLPKFYAEAKKCGVNIQADPAPAYQLRRYGWSAKVAVSILTDFEELAIYDCTTRPRESDKASRARILYFKYREYPERWRELWDVFSREAVWSGAFDQYAASKRKRGTSEVDVEFLKEIEGWRERLARNMAIRNADLSSDDLNAAVQLTIDRVVFLRMAEDRGLEPYEQLLKLCERPNAYARFMRDLCRTADEKYNSGLFHFEKEPGISDPPDRLTSKLAVDDKAFVPILESLYFAHGSPYYFGVMPVEILGTVYERFLGKVIRLTAGHQAKVEEKPEVRKAGGVYYTPSYIVQYIVKQTVGRLIEGRSPAQLAGEKAKPPFRVLDMACGSGSFLLGAYQYLLDHCLKWYIDHKPESHKKAVCKDPQDDHWRLTIEEKKRILTTHLFGVDIDRQAVEVSKLSLLLKALEGENDATMSLQLQLFHNRALPNLADNIKCGNSLIGPSYFAGRLPLDRDEGKRVNAFDWKTEFPDAHRAGGFDCIIGNPPYIRIQTMQEWAALEVGIYKELFQTAREGNYDIYVVFVERGLQLLNPLGRLGFICPHKFFNAKYGAPLRSLIAGGNHLAQVVYFGDQQVFDGATTYTCLLFLDKSPAKECPITNVRDLTAWRAVGAGTEGVIKASEITGAGWNFSVGNGAALFARLREFPAKLGDIADRMAQGIRTSANEVYVLDIVRESSNLVTAHSDILDRDVKIERKALSLFLQGREIKPYRILPSGKAVIVPYTIQNGRAAIVPESELRSRFPRLHAYLSESKDYLAARERGRMRGPNWYAFIYPKNIDMMRKPKILVPDIADRASFALDERGEYAFTSGYGITLRPDVTESPKYVLGLLNSALLDFYLKRVSTTMRGGFFRYFTQFIEQLPIRRIDFAKSADKAAHDRVVSLVESILASHKQHAAAKSEADREIIDRQIKSIEAEINRRMYDLYGLTDEEIAVVEGSARSVAPDAVAAIHEGLADHAEGRTKPARAALGKLATKRDLRDDFDSTP